MNSRVQRCRYRNVRGFERSSSRRVSNHRIQAVEMGFSKSAFLFLGVLFVVVNSTPIETPAAQTLCLCHLDWRPVCGSNGQTYGNLCAFNCAKNEAVRLGRAEISVRNNGQCTE